MPVSKNQRRARHEQAESPTIGRGSPSKNDGRIGSQQFKRIAGKGLVHMVKSDIGWQEMGSSQTSSYQCHSLWPCRFVSWYGELFPQQSHP